MDSDYDDEVLDESASQAARSEGISHAQASTELQEMRRDMLSLERNRRDEEKAREVIRLEELKERRAERAQTSEIFKDLLKEMKEFQNLPLLILVKLKKILN